MEVFLTLTPGKITARFGTKFLPGTELIDDTNIHTSSHKCNAIAQHGICMIRGGSEMFIKMKSSYIYWIANVQNN